jgi:hypothetical protein
MSNEQEQEREQPPANVRKKSNRAAGKAAAKRPEPKPDRRTARDGKPVRKTASGFTVVG